MPYLPIGAHVAVVDPGVGTARLGIALQTLRGDYLVGPDNGLLMPAAARLGGITRVHLLEDPRYSLPEISSSFHGRDVFAPAAAHLAAAWPSEKLGRAVDPRRLLDLDWPAPTIQPGGSPGPGHLPRHLRQREALRARRGPGRCDARAAIGRAADRFASGPGQPVARSGVSWVRTFGDVATGGAPS